MEKSSRRWNELTQSVCYFLAKDMQPIDTVNDTGFRTMLKKFEPRYIPPDRKTVSTNYLPQLYQAETDRVKKLLDPITSYACTTDMWTSRARHAYISLTAHYLDNEFSLCNNLLAVKEFPESHTSSNIADELESMLQEWNLEIDGLSAFTTDNGVNVANAIDLMGQAWVPCISHCLNLAVEKACSISDVSKALARCRRLVSHFNHSSKSSYLLKQKQESLSHPTHILIQDVATRWNSAYYMVSRVIEQQQPVCATLLELKKTDLMPSDNEFSSMETYVNIMKPLVMITEAIGAEQWVTISTVRPILYKLMTSHLVETSNDTQLGKRMKHEMLTDLRKRYTEDTMLLLSQAAFLDPRMKSLPFLSASKRTEIIQAIESNTVRVLDTVSETNLESPANTTQEPPKKRRKGEHQLMNLIDDIMSSAQDDSQCSSVEQSSSLTVRERVEAEISRYTSEPNYAGDPLKWWKANASRYPHLVHLARKYLCIPATSVPSERVFSSAGHIVSKKRACLDPSSVNMLVFLAENLQ